MDQLDDALRRYFGFEEFRSGQREVIERIFARQHTLAVLPTGLGKSLCYQLASQLLPGITLVISPLIALMQDQVESLLRRGFKNVTFLSSALEPAQVGARYKEIEQGRYKLVYVAPERCDSPRLQQLVREGRFDLLVIDEAHCISQWGHDFRPHYRLLLTRLPELKRATMLALTATATPAVQNDIAATLGQPDIGRVIADFNRPNLRFESIRVDKRQEKDARLIELLADKNESAIVYASTRKEADYAYRLLRDRGLNVCLYHAGLEPAERTATHRRFQKGDARIIVATVAFGLGIDKPDIRRVVHYNIPGSPESYYQEAGRAGRDGDPAVCTLLYSQQDLRIQRFLIDSAYPEPPTVFQLYQRLYDAHPLPVPLDDLATASELAPITVSAALQILYEQQWLKMTPDGKYQIARPDCERPQIDFRPLAVRRKRANDRLKTMIEYAAGQTCRRAQILNYFGQKFAPPCDACDVCCPAEPTHSESLSTELPATEASNRVARIILQTVADFGGRLGRSLVTDVLSGSKRKRIVELKLDQSRNYGALSLHRHDRVMTWIDELSEQGLLRVTAEEFPRVLITEAGQQALGTATLLPLSVLVRARAEGAHALAAHASVGARASVGAGALGGHASSVQSSGEKARDTVPELAARLKQWRLEKASALAVPAFTILHNSVLDEIARTQPATLIELGEIKGIGQNKTENFGAEILTIVRSVSETESDLAETEPATEASPSAPTQPTERFSTLNTKGGGAPELGDLWLQLEMWRQGGAAPDSQVLLDVLKNRSELERGGLIIVINALAELGAKQSIPELKQLMSETSDGNLLSTVCKALAELKATETVPDLIKLLDDARPGVRRAAARALGRLRAQAALVELERLANEDEQESVRLSARAAALLIKEQRNVNSPASIAKGAS